MSHHDPSDWDTDAPEIECPHCGEEFYFELTSCPNCGKNVYPSEDEDLIEDDYSSEFTSDFLEDWFAEFAKPATIFLGLVISFVASTAIFLAVRLILKDFAFSWPGRGILLVSAPIGAAIGGYAAAAIDKRQPRTIGFWVGGLSVIAAIVLAAVDADRTGSWFGLESIPLWLLTVLSGASGAEYWRRQQRDAIIQNLFIDFEEEDVLYEDLLTRIGQDEEKAERLIEYERQFMPNATRRTLIESAIERWKRDNR